MYNLSLLPLFVAAQLEGIIIPVAALSVPVLIVFAVFYFKTQNRRLWHETARIALEKGQPLPAMDDAVGTSRNESNPRNDVRAGLVLIAVGTGIYLGFREMLIAAYIPGFIGIALLINAAITALIARKSARPDPKLSPPHL